MSWRLPDDAREELQQPWGPIVQTDGVVAAVGDAMVVAVGDVVALTCQDVGIEPQLFVCDYKTQRGDASDEYELRLSTWGTVAFTVKNKAGQISKEAWNAVKLGMQATQKPVRIVVRGEEDLLAIPCFLEAPLGAKVLYGVPGQGVCVVDVTAELQATVRALVARMAV